MTWLFSITLSQEKKKLEDYGHDDCEWGHRDDYEKIEWEEHYQVRKSKWGYDSDNDEDRQD